MKENQLTKEKLAMIVLYKNYKDYLSSIQRKKEQSRKIMMYFFAVGATTSLVFSSLYKTEPSYFQSLFQLAVALNLAIATLDAFIPKADIDKFRDEVKKSRNELQEMMDETVDELRERERSVIDISSIQRDPRKVVDITEELGVRYQKKLVEMEFISRAMDETYKVFFDYRSGSFNDMISYRRDRMALVASALAFTALVITSFIPTLEYQEKSFLDIASIAFLGGIVSFCYAPIALVLFSAQAAIRWRNDLQDAAIRIKLRVIEIKRSR